MPVIMLSTAQCLAFTVLQLALLTLGVTATASSPSNAYPALTSDNKIGNVVVGVPSFADSMVESLPAVHETWASEFEHIHFFSDTDAPPALGSAPLRNIGSDHALQAAYQMHNEHPDAPWYYVASERSFVNSARLGELLAEPRFASGAGDWYLGLPTQLKYARDEYVGPVFCSGDAGYLLSNSLMRKIAPRLLDPMATCCADAEVGTLVEQATDGEVQCSAPEGYSFADASMGSALFMREFDRDSMPVDAVEQASVAYGSVSPLHQFRYHRRFRRNRQRRGLAGVEAEAATAAAADVSAEAEDRELQQMYPSYHKYRHLLPGLTTDSSERERKLLMIGGIDMKTWTEEDKARHSGRHNHNHAAYAPAYHPRVADAQKAAAAGAAGAVAGNGTEGSGNTTTPVYIQHVCGENGYKCVISFGLYGKNPKYTTGAIRNAWLIREVYPGWIARFNYDKDSVPPTVLNTLKNYGAELIPYDKSTFHSGISGMYARFLVAEDNTVDRYIIRDSDSRLNWREKHAVTEWIASGYSIHALRDHQGHGRPLNGGMWGGVKGIVKNLLGRMAKANQNAYNEDQKFLCNVLYPEIIEDQIAHDSAYCNTFKNSYAYPTRRYFAEHVGQVFSHEEEPVLGHINFLLDDVQVFEAPAECRKHPHWTKG